jgi:hypothetical protein
MVASKVIALTRWISPYAREEDNAYAVFSKSSGGGRSGSLQGIETGAEDGFCTSSWERLETCYRQIARPTQKRTAGGSAYRRLRRRVSDTESTTERTRRTL